MGRLDNITLKELHELHKKTKGGKPRERVLAAIGKKQGNKIDILADRHGVVEKTSATDSIGWLIPFSHNLAGDPPRFPLE